jgi:hypothetical protein
VALSFNYFAVIEKQLLLACQTMIFGKMFEVKSKMDFIQWLGPDMSIKVLSYLDDPCDLVRVSFVSRSWNRFGKPFDLYYMIR